MIVSCPGCSRRPAPARRAPRLPGGRRHGGVAGGRTMDDRRADVTAILADVSGPRAAWERLLPLVYDELRELAARQVARERAGHTLQATALVHEAWLRLVGDEAVAWSGRRHFFGAAAEAMRRVLVDHARKVRAAKRGGDRARLSLTLSGLAVEDDPDRLLALDEALSRLQAEDERAAEVAWLRFFAGLSVEETALALEVSQRTVMREWTFARARLSELLGDPAGEA